MLAIANNSEVVERNQISNALKVEGKLGESILSSLFSEPNDPAPGG